MEVSFKVLQEISSSEDYIPPEDYTEGINLKPSEFSDIGQAEVFVNEYESTVRFSLLPRDS